MCLYASRFTFYELTFFFIRPVKRVNEIVNHEPFWLFGGIVTMHNIKLEELEETYGVEVKKNAVRSSQDFPKKSQTSRDEQWTWTDLCPVWHHSPSPLSEVETRNTATIWWWNYLGNGKPGTAKTPAHGHTQVVVQNTAYVGCRRPEIWSGPTF